MSHASYPCPKCGKNMFPGFVLGPTGKLIVECANGECQFQDPTLGPNDFNTGLAKTEKNEQPGWGSTRALVVDPLAKPQPVAPTPAQMMAPTITTVTVPPYNTAGAASFIAAPPPLPSNPADVLSMIEDRAHWLAAEAARLEGVIAQTKALLAGVTTEKRQLDKMLRAGRRETPRARDDHASSNGVLPLDFKN